MTIDYIFTINTKIGGEDFLKYISHLCNVTNISSQVGEVTGNNKSCLPFRSIAEVASTKTTGL